MKPDKKIHPDLVLPGDSDPGKGRIMQQNYRNTILISSNTLQFNKTFAKTHNVGLLLGQEAQLHNNRFLFAELEDISNNPSQEEIMGTNIKATSDSKRTALLSYFAQLSYGFRDKLFLSGSIKKDGSSQFGTEC